MTRRPFYGWVVLAAAFIGWSRSGIGAIGLSTWVVMGLGPGPRRGSSSWELLR